MQKLQDSFETPYSNSKKNNTNTNKKTKIIINVSQTQYSIVKHVAKKLKWNLYLEPVNNLNFDICWMDGHVRQELFARMQSNQKINHFPGMGVLSRKNNLGKNLMLFRKKFPSDYEFFPITWTLPTQYQELQTYHECRQQGKAQTFIVKPEASCQGRGIFLTRNIQKLKNDKYVVQRYMHKPYLIDDLKFDLRIYVLVTGIDPLRIFVYEEGLARFATEQYKPPRSDNLDNRFMHLTNYAVNKQNPNFVFNQSASQMDVGHKRSLTSVYKQIEEDGHDVEELKRKINDIFIKTIITGYPTLSNTFLSIHPDNFANDMCFQILGFDIMIDHKLTPYLIEINYTPSFSTDTPLDRQIKKNLIYDTLELINLNDRWKKEMKQKRDKQIQERMVTGKRKKYSNEQRRNIMLEQAKKRNAHEQQNMGRFTKIFLLNEEQMNQYRKYYDFSYQLYNNFSNNNVNTFTPTAQYPFYKYYFQTSNKPPYFNGSVSKSKKYPVKEATKQSNLTKIVEVNVIQKTRQQVVGSSQGRRISSAKSKKVKKQMTEKGSSKATLRNEEEVSGKELIQFEPCLENQSIFQNKKIEQLMVLKKRKSQALLLDCDDFVDEN